MAVDVKSSTWLAIAEWANKEITLRHELLEMARLSHEDTQFIRGELGSFRAAEGVTNGQYRNSR